MLSHSWNQIGFLARIVRDRDAEAMDLLITPLVGVHGARWKGYAEGRKKGRRDLWKRASAEGRAPSPPEESSAKDARRLASLAAHGIAVRVVRASPPREDADAPGNGLPTAQDGVAESPAPPGGETGEDDP